MRINRHALFRLLPLVLIITVAILLGVLAVAARQMVQPAPAARAVPSPVPALVATPSRSALAASAMLPGSAESAARPTPQPTSAPTRAILPLVATAQPGQPAASEDANLRTGPGLQYAIIGTVKTGAALPIVACNPDRTWYELEDGRWIFGELVKDPPRAVQVEMKIPTPPGK